MGIIASNALWRNYESGFGHRVVGTGHPFSVTAHLEVFCPVRLVEGRQIFDLITGVRSSHGVPTDISHGSPGSIPCPPTSTYYIRIIEKVLLNHHNKSYYGIGLVVVRDLFRVLCGLASNILLI